MSCEEVFQQRWTVVTPQVTYLAGLTQAHLISQDAAILTMEALGKPVDSLQLIRA